MTTDSLKAALEPFLRAINQLEKDYGFDRPMHQGQCLMLRLSDLIALREAAALRASADAAPVAGELKALIEAGIDEYSARCALRTEADGGFCHAYFYSDGQWRFQTGGNDITIGDETVRCLLTKRLYAHPPVPDAAGEEEATKLADLIRTRLLGIDPDDQDLQLDDDDWRLILEALAQPPAAEPVLEAVLNQNDMMRQELAHVGNLVSDLERAMGVNPANEDGSWPDLGGRITRLKEAARNKSAAEPVGMREAMERAVAKAKADGASEEDIAVHWLAYNYLEAALATGNGGEGRS